MEIISDKMKEGSNVTLRESGEEQKSWRGDPCGLSDSRTHFQLKPDSLVTIIRMQNTEYVEKEEDFKDQDEGEDEEDEEEETKRKRNCTPHQTSPWFGAVLR